MRSCQLSPIDRSDQGSDDIIKVPSESGNEDASSAGFRRRVGGGGGGGIRREEDVASMAEAAMLLDKARILY